tara:strand:+ start:584 stop:1060 length:477 start_codon:yes stop_codon:yes gene_type:complete
MEDMIMHNFDLSPLFRTSVGFDRLNNLFDAALHIDEAPSYPPYNIEKLDADRYSITMAVAGFGEADVEVLVKDNTLTVNGKIGDAEEAKSYLYRGIAGRAFNRSFQIADHIKVTGAELDNGLLHIELIREIPEEMRPRRIAIGNSKAKSKILSHKKAA